MPPTNREKLAALVEEMSATPWRRSILPCTPNLRAECYEISNEANACWIAIVQGESGGFNQKNPRANADAIIELVNRSPKLLAIWRAAEALSEAIAKQNGPISPVAQIKLNTLRAALEDAEHD